MSMSAVGRRASDKSDDGILSAVDRIISRRKSSDSSSKRTVGEYSTEINTTKTKNSHSPHRRRQTSNADDSQDDADSDYSDGLAQSSLLHNQASRSRQSRSESTSPTRGIGRPRSRSRSFGDSYNANEFDQRQKPLPFPRKSHDSPHEKREAEISGLKRNSRHNSTASRDKRSVSSVKDDENDGVEFVHNGTPNRSVPSKHPQPATKLQPLRFQDPSPSSATSNPFVKHGRTRHSFEAHDDYATTSPKPPRHRSRAASIGSDDDDDDAVFKTDVNAQIPEATASELPSSLTASKPNNQLVKDAKTKPPTTTHQSRPISKTKQKPFKLQRRSLSSYNFTDSLSLRQAAYSEWLRQKELEAEYKKKESEMQKTLEDRKKEEKEQRKEEANATYLAWKREREEIRKREQAQLNRKKKTMEEKKEEEKVNKVKESELMFRSWQEEKARQQRSASRDKKKKAREEEDKRFEKEQKRQEAQKAFEAWREIKDDELKQKLKARRKSDDLQVRKKPEKEIDQDAFEKWLERKESEKREATVWQFLRRADEPTPPWIPTNRTVPSAKNLRLIKRPK